MGCLYLYDDGIFYYFFVLFFIYCLCLVLKLNVVYLFVGGMKRGDICLVILFSFDESLV